jgi:probable rRNA maturation factor
LSIRVFYDEIKFRVKGSEKIKKFLYRVIIEENKLPGDLKFIFTGDRNLIEINRKFLGHDYYTDVITFGENEDNVVNGEIYISLDTVRENADKYKIGTGEEIIRVMLHGILHLCGYNDETEGEKEIMIKRQEELVSKFRGVQ